uniref:Uncharacterized protein n=1 Tax=Octactis speculum TaxID=3111310 RepID=A0A7S2G6Z7_9STRA
MVIPDSRLELNTTFHASSLDEQAPTTQSRVPLCIGFSAQIATRFGLFDYLNPWMADGAEKFKFRVFCDGPHGVFLSAPTIEGLDGAIHFFLCELERTRSEGIPLLDYTVPIEAPEEIETETRSQSELQAAQYLLSRCFDTYGDQMPVEELMGVFDRISGNGSSLEMPRLADVEASCSWGGVFLADAQTLLTTASKRKSEISASMPTVSGVISAGEVES